MKRDEDLEFEIIFKEDFKMDAITETEMELIGKYLPDVLREIMNRIPSEGEQ